MDKIVQTQLDELILELKNSDGVLKDPVSKLMVTTLIHQAQKIKDEIARIPEKIVQRLCSIFVPKNKIDAIPAICLVQPSLKSKQDVDAHQISDNVYFSYKINTKQSLTYYPLCQNVIIPYTQLYILTPNKLISNGIETKIQFGKKGQVWIGLSMSHEIESLQNVSFLIKGFDGLIPQKIFVGNNQTELRFADASKFDELPISSPFDSQQMSATFVDTISIWRRNITGDDSNRLLYITDSLKDRDAFKLRAYPKVFQQYLESNDLDSFDSEILWIMFDFGSDYEVPTNIEILPNVMPVVNISINNATLTQASPITKLTKNDGASFFSIVETPLSYQRQGFNRTEEEFVIRDFDINCYNPDSLYTDIRNLYNHFIDDYYAFINYHSIKDGESIKALRELMNRVGKGVLKDTDNRDKYNTGVYAMRNISISNQSITTKITYLTTFGRLGNSPQAGSIMENKKDVALSKDVRVITNAVCGEDKADVDQLYELLRYHTMTTDRLFTKMDIDAFIRLQLLKQYGKEEIKRIEYNIAIRGAGGDRKLCRGLYIELIFRDKKNYEKAINVALDKNLIQNIEAKSCISMPIIVNLKCLDV